VRIGDSPVTVKLTPAPGQRGAKDSPAPVPTGYKNDIPY
jgi:hypothetical protein